MAIVIPATRAAAESIARLQNNTLPEAPWSRDDLIRFVNDAHSLALIALNDDGVLAGFILGRSIGHDAEILSIVVDHDVRQRGFGFRLISAAFESLRSRGAHRVFLEVAADNVAALRLYVKLGLHLSGRRPQYYRRDREHYEDAIILSCTLDP